MKKETSSLAFFLNFINISVFCLVLSSYFSPLNQFYQAKLNLNRWPLSPQAHCYLAKIYFNAGDEENAVKELEKGIQLYSSLYFLDFNQSWKNNLKKTEKLILSPKKTKEEITYWETVLKTRPHYRDLFLRLSVLNYQVFQNEKTHFYWKKAFYLDPNNKTTQKLGKILGLIK